MSLTNTVFVSDTSCRLFQKQDYYWVKVKSAGMLFGLRDIW